MPASPSQRSAERQGSVKRVRRGVQGRAAGGSTTTRDTTAKSLGQKSGARCVSHQHRQLCERERARARSKKWSSVPSLCILLLLLLAPLLSANLYFSDCKYTPTFTFPTASDCSRNSVVTYGACVLLLPLLAFLPLHFRFLCIFPGQDHCFYAA